MNDQWKEYVEDVRDTQRAAVECGEFLIGHKLLKLVDAQDAVVKAAEKRAEVYECGIKFGCGPDATAQFKADLALTAALRALAELKLE